MEKVKVGISIGDINGVGLEVILKTLHRKEILKYCVPVIYGSSKVLSYHKNIVGLDDFSFSTANSIDRVRHDRINVVNCWQDNVNITLGKLSDTSGKYAYISLEQATNDLKNGSIDALVTAPIHKKAMQMANFPYPGHTEYITNAFGVSESLMLMVNDELRIGLATNHLPLRDVPEVISKEKIRKKLQIFNKSLKVDFGIERPSIAVLALNPHASDDGLIGTEEEQVIRPVVIEAKKKGVLVMGPFPADGFFGSGTFKKFDGILAMYHDQGLVPFKTLSFGQGVNYTAGLPSIRTSPDHGTAYDIAGKNMADPASFRRALFLAIDIAKKRKAYQEMHANPLKKRQHEQVDEDPARIEEKEGSQ
ncbi:MAG: 4-hydroxythreonine-4-phosphate dehydrogenase PdxA [Bacteroidota bacterium]